MEMEQLPRRSSERVPGNPVRLSLSLSLSLSFSARLTLPLSITSFLSSILSRRLTGIMLNVADRKEVYDLRKDCNQGGRPKEVGRRHPTGSNEEVSCSTVDERCHDDAVCSDSPVSLVIVEAFSYFQLPIMCGASVLEDKKVGKENIPETALMLEGEEFDEYPDPLATRRVIRFKERQERIPTG
ncbi:hypothetical protein L2E82_16629 [Cichorium intybus]|uniref:Uncharacterized protein n=1 Tax=Cichorium intybus TaxID=13427 RepID=A0ACB9F6N3_CICIN|nr:hypothetical protein L2E82_16629 [Cichorium intybus]